MERSMMLSLDSTWENRADCIFYLHSYFEGAEQSVFYIYIEYCFYAAQHSILQDRISIFNVGHHRSGLVGGPLSRRHGFGCVGGGGQGGSPLDGIAQTVCGKTCAAWVAHAGLELSAEGDLTKAFVFGGREPYLQGA